MSIKPIYSEEEYTDLDMQNYRNKFPSETARFTDKELFDAVMSTDDDMLDTEWKTFFIEYKVS